VRWSWTNGVESTKVETRDSQFIVPSELTNNSGNFADVNVNPDQALRLSAVWACVNLLSNTVSTLPLKAYRPGGAEFNPVLLDSPAAGWTLPDWLEAIMRSLLLRGNLYGFVTARSGPRMSPSQVELVDPDLVSVNVSPSGEVTYRFRGREVDPSDLWHVRAFRYPGSPLGLSPIQYASEVVGLGLSTRRFGQAYFSDGATPTGVLKVGQPVSQEMLNLTRAYLDRATHGRRQPLVVSGDASWTPLSISPEQSQFIDAMRFNVTEVARIFGVPAAMVDGQSEDSNTYANLEGRSLHFLQYSLNPWLIRLENAISSLLPGGAFVKFTTAALLKSTTRERYDSYEVALRAGFLTLDEVRELEDRPSLEPGQLRLIPEAGVS
jgi:HK97 family phage portal protein